MKIWKPLTNFKKQRNGWAWHADVAIEEGESLSLLVAVALVATAGAQSSSLLGDPAQRGLLRLSDVSYSYVQVEPPKELKIPLI